jgi:hypothetical protein
MSGLDVGPDVELLPGVAAMVEMPVAIGVSPIVWSGIENTGGSWADAVASEPMTKTARAAATAVIGKKSLRILLLIYHLNRDCFASKAVNRSGGSSFPRA